MGSMVRHAVVRRQHYACQTIPQALDLAPAITVTRGVMHWLVGLSRQCCARGSTPNAYATQRTRFTWTFS